MADTASPAGERGEPSDAPVRRLVGFGRYLRRYGLPVGPGRVLTFCRAAAALNAFDRGDLFLAARTTLVSRHEDFEVLDAAFERYFRPGDPEGLRPDASLTGEEGPEARATETGGPEREAGTRGSGPTPSATWSTVGPDDEVEGEAAIRIVASDAEILRSKDFAALDQDERRAIVAQVRRLSVAIPRRHGRRYRAAAGGARFDLRRTLRQSLRTHGEPFRREWMERTSRQRPLVLILDVSGSMAPYSRPLLEFAHAAAAAGRRVEVFVFGTHLTRITRSLGARDPGEALVAVGSAVSDWEGGTRIGESLRELLEGWSTRSALRGSVVILCSDGLERGDPQVLAQQMERLSRLAHRLLWINPLKGSPRYEPLARGMAASLPFVDVFLPGHNLESLEALSAAVTMA